MRPRSPWYTYLHMPTLRRIDVIASLIIGEAAALLMLAIGSTIPLPSGPRALAIWLPFIFPLFTVSVVAVGVWLGRYRLGFYQLSKFGLVGGLNFLIDLGVLNFLIAASDMVSGLPAAAFKAVAFLVAMTSSFLWNKFWTFRSLSIERVGLQFAEFFVVSAVGIGINVGVFAAVNDFIGPPPAIPPRAWASAAAAAAAAVGLIWNFFGYKFLVFRRESRK